MNKLMEYCYEKKHSEGKEAVQQLYNELSDIVIDKESFKEKIRNTIMFCEEEKIHILKFLE
jgi:hypothetical protein